MLVLGIALAAKTTAQGPFEFSATLTLLEPRPPGSEQWGGAGTFSLQGNTLNYRVVVVPWGPSPEAEVRGPDANGPVLFGLTFLGCQPPLDWDPGSCVFRGTAVVPDTAIPDLLANNWFVTASYHGMDAELHYAGRIVLVPEPSLLCIFGVSAAGWAVFRWIRTNLNHASARMPQIEPIRESQSQR
jgi:hypothetical protein